MSASREVPIIISQPTPTFLGLVEKAARDTHDKTISAREKLVKLDFTSSYANVHNEFKRSYLDKVSETTICSAGANDFLTDPTRFLYRYNPRSKQNQIMVATHAMGLYRRVFSDTEPDISCGNPFGKSWKS